MEQLFYICPSFLCHFTSNLEGSQFSLCFCNCNNIRQVAAAFQNSVCKCFCNLQLRLHPLGGGGVRRRPSVRANFLYCEVTREMFSDCSVCVRCFSSLVCRVCTAVNGNVECARILLQTSQNDDRNAVNCVDKLERF